MDQERKTYMRIERLKPNRVWDSTPYNFAQAVRVRQTQDLLFIAGQAGMDESGQIVQGLEAQIRQSFENIRRVVSDAGGSMANVVRITGYLRDMNALGVYTKMVSEFFTGNLPAATVVEVKALALEPLLVEVDAIAVL
jgi:2-iminobutanoate/2-iminopropanoate deaminase